MIPQFLELLLKDPLDCFPRLLPNSDLRLLEQGLAAGITHWEGGTSNNTVYYARTLWQHQADTLAPRSKQKDYAEEIGKIYGYEHLLITPDLGIFMKQSKNYPKTDLKEALSIGSLLLEKTSRDQVIPILRRQPSILN